MNQTSNEKPNSDDAQAERNARALNAAYSLVAGRVPVPATPTGRNPAASTNELATDIESAGVPADDRAAIAKAEGGAS